MTNGASESARMKPKAKIFVCYARADEVFVGRIVESLESRDFDVLIDQHDKAAAEDWSKDIHKQPFPFEHWWKEIQRLIAQADTVVFVISPASVESPVCQKELAEAASLNKRLAPIVHLQVSASTVPEPARQPQWINFEDKGKFEVNLAGLAAALKIDIEWIRKHTELGGRAQRWDEVGRPNPHGLMLRPPLLEAAEAWIAERPSEAPEPTDATRVFIAASRAAFDQERVDQELALRRERIVVAVEPLWSVAADLWDLGDQATAVRLWLAAIPDSNADLAAFERELKCIRVQPLKAKIALVSKALRTAGSKAVKPWRSAKAPEAWRPALSAFSVGGRYAFTQSRDKLPQVWNAIADTADDLIQADMTMIQTKALMLGTVVGLVVALAWSDAYISTPGGNVHLPALFLGGLVFAAVWRYGKKTYNVSAAAFRDDGELLATTKKNTVRVLDSSTGRAVATLRGHKKFVCSVRFSSDGKRVVTGSSDGTARIWDLNSDGSSAVLGGHHGSVLNAAFSPDGRRVLTVDASDVRIWDVETRTYITVGQEGGTLGQEGGASAAFTTDGRYVVVFGPVYSDLSGRVDRIFDRRSRLRIFDGLSGAPTLVNEQFYTGLNRIFWRT